MVYCFSDEHKSEYLHERNLFHRDIKLQNIFIKSSKNLTDVILGNFATAEYIMTNLN